MPTLNILLSKIPSIFLILNKQRQIIYMNQGALNFSGLQDFTAIIGQRPGELFGCINSQIEDGGCGTAEACEYCAAVNVVLESQIKGSAVDDCRLILGPDEKAFDLRIWAMSLMIRDENFTAVTIQDIQNEKRRTILENVFFHDILNTTTTILGTVRLLTKYGEKMNSQEALTQLERSTYTFLEEIQHHRTLRAAENKNLAIEIKPINSLELLEELRVLYIPHSLTQKKKLILAKTSEDLEISSDKILLKRVLSNMIKNALEAIPEGATVKIGCRKISQEIHFWVHNPGFIPRKIQLQMFQRSFSTKGLTRGLGTYSMKLLSFFLNGRIEFSTSKDNGTIFTAIYPIIAVEPRYETV